MVTEQGERVPRLKEKQGEDDQDLQGKLEAVTAVTGHIEKGSKEEFKTGFKGPTPPKSMTSEEQKAVEQSVQRIVAELKTADGKEGFDLADKIGSTGAGQQKLASDKFKHDQTRLSELFEFDRKEGGTEIRQSISRLQETLRKVHPKYVEREAWIRFIKMVPLMGNWMIKVLETIAQRKQTTEDFVQELEESLHSRQERLRLTYANIVVALDHTEKDREVIKGEAYCAELFWVNLEELIREIRDPEKKAFLEDVLDEVVGRAQDLRAMDEAYAQYQQTVRIYRKTNRLTRKAIDRIIEMGLNLVRLSFLIYAALIEQKNALELVQETRIFMGEQIRQNAALLKKNIEMLGDILKNPMVAMQALEDAHNTIMQAIDDFDRIRAESRAAASENIAKMKLMTQELDEKVRAPEKEQSLGLGDLLPSRPAGGVERPKI